jgi:glucosylceramidase
MVDGFAYHWYSGDHFDALSLLHGRYPDKILMHSESCGLHIPGKTTAFVLSKEQEKELAGKKMELENAGAVKTPNECDFEDALHYAHDIIGDLNHGMQRWIDWNLVVDRNGGPRHVPGGFAAPLVYEDNGTVTKTVTYHYLRTIARTVQRGAVRLGSSSYGKEAEAAAVQNPDGSIGVLVLNQEKKDIRVNLRFAGKIVRNVSVPAGTLAGIRIMN